MREAYAAQYARDMDAFLSARGEEVVAGGIVVMVLIGFRDGYVLGSDSGIGEAFDVLGSCLYDMVKMVSLLVISEFGYGISAKIITTKSKKNT